jgi:hypothetical protein
MGLIELHFHESKFDFSPSVTTGADEETALEAADSEGDDEDVESAGWKDEGSESSSSAGVGALVALVVLVMFAALVGLKRRGGDDEDVELEA